MILEKDVKRVQKWERKSYRVIEVISQTNQTSGRRRKLGRIDKTNAVWLRW